METLDFTTIKNTLLVGAGGKTGYWYARLLLQDGYDVYAFDRNEKVEYSDDLTNHPGFHRVSTPEFDDVSILEKVDSITLSPGVSLGQVIFQSAHQQNKFLFSELEYCVPRLSDRSWICVTGTDGKSTTVALIEHSLNGYDKTAISCGNYGLSFSRMVYEYDKYVEFKYLVAELSSYQLELCRNLESDVSLYLNLAPDHLDRYKDVEHYGLVKWNIALAVKDSGSLIVNQNLLPGFTEFWSDEHPVRRIHNKISVMSVDTVNLKSEHFQVVSDAIKRTIGDEIIMKLSDLNIQGAHNHSNILFALETLRHFKLDDPAISALAFNTFKGLAHRYERIDSDDGNIYINDSKATTTQAAEIAIKNSGSPLILFMGGRSKGESYDNLAQVVKHKQAIVFLFGENRFEFQGAFTKHQVNIAGIDETLQQVFDAAVKYSQDRQLTGVTFLLSPASTSWDQYSSFEERGTHFQNLVAAIT